MDGYVSVSKVFQNITIFDWDDTLLCTSSFYPFEEKDVNWMFKDKKSEVLKELDN
jgi:hypothetical protein